jgi:prepilin-type N-terminal cleavage/methylation domain-containing protein
MIDARCRRKPLSGATRWQGCFDGTDALVKVPRVAGYTLIEMLTTIAVLVIAMGLMASLARRVRAQSAESVTKNLLRSLDVLMSQYVSQHHQLPVVASFVPEKMEENTPLDEATLQMTARQNNRDLLRVLRGQLGATGTPFADQPASIYDDSTLKDAWGTPIVFMPSYHPAVGMAPENHYFFVSAGPDGHFFTRDDNLYSYEGPGVKPFEVPK